MCKSFDVNGPLKNAEWKFQSKVTNWYQLETRVDFDQVFPIKNDQKLESLKKQHQNILDDTFRKINSAIIAIEDLPKPPQQLIEVTGNKKKKDLKESKTNGSNSSDKSLQAAIYIPCVRQIIIILVLLDFSIYYLI